MTKPEVDALIEENAALRREVSDLRSVVIRACDEFVSNNARWAGLRIVRRAANDTSKPFSHARVEADALEAWRDPNVIFGDLFRELRRDGVMGKVSDGYHTFDELYDHRCTLFIALCYMVQRVDLGIGAWRAKQHDDGSALDGWFLLGITHSGGDRDGQQMTYHLPLSRWDECGFVLFTYERAPAFDGHTSADVLERLKEVLQVKHISELNSEQLSMMASASAIGEVFCCNKIGHTNREIVVDTLPDDVSYRSQATRDQASVVIAEFAHNSMGCGHEDLVPIADIENYENYFEPETSENRNYDRAKARRYLEKFFEAVGC